MSDYTITFSGFGLCSSLGGFHDACAAYRAGLNRFAAHEEMKTMEAGDEEPTELTVAPAAANLWPYQGVGRSIKMLHAAYLDLLGNLKREVPEEGLQLLLALPDPEDRQLDMDPMPGISRAERLQEYLSAITDPLLPKMGSAFTKLPIQSVFGDRVAFARILQKAAQLLGNGEAKHCLLIITDSLLNDVTLDAQLEQDLLKHGGNPVGYIPGEGAAMILLSSGSEPESENDKWNAHRAKIGVCLNNEMIDYEEEGAEIALWQGERLSSLIKSQLRNRYENMSFPQHIADINGEECRAIEVGSSLVKLMATYSGANFAEPQVPALSFGELGTMMGPMALATAIASVQRKYARQREFLITLSEDTGKRAVIHMQF